MLLTGPRLFAADTNSELLDQIPPLRPPRGEIPPSFWEQHGLAITMAGIFVVLAATIVAWVLTRPKPVLPVPPIVQARQALEALRGKPEDGLVLSKVSQILRRFIATEFKLADGELTTSDFSALVTANDPIGPALAGQLTQFFRESDQRKFAPSSPAPPLDAVSTAFKLIDLAEARQAGLRAASARLASLSDEPARTRKEQV